MAALHPAFEHGEEALDGVGVNVAAAHSPAKKIVKAPPSKRGHNSWTPLSLVKNRTRIRLDRETQEGGRLERVHQNSVLLGGTRSMHHDTTNHLRPSRQALHGKRALCFFPSSYPGMPCSLATIGTLTCSERQLPETKQIKITLAPRDGLTGASMALEIGQDLGDPAAGLPQLGFVFVHCPRRCRLSHRCTASRSTSWRVRSPRAASSWARRPRPGACTGCLAHPGPVAPVRRLRVPASRT